VIVVDSSVMIDHVRDHETWQVVTLRRLIRGDIAGPILVGDIIMCEVLAGLRATREIKERLESLLLVSMLGFDLVPRAVANYHKLGGAGSPRAPST
jgi:predicted nucleic acid-binding protein